MTEEKANSKEALENALRLVREAIQKEEKRLRSIAEREEQSPVVVEGMTKAGYLCQLMADPKDAAKILLDYSYPVWRVLGEDAPDGMWNELADMYGLESVSSIDL